MQTDCSKEPQGSDSSSRPTTPLPNIHGKPVHTVRTRILNPTSEFKGKLLCDGPTFSPGSACVFTCRYCYVEKMMNRGSSAVAATLQEAKQGFQEMVIRRDQPLGVLRSQLRHHHGSLRFKDDTRVIFASPAVDVAPTIELAQEATELCLEILESTGWSIRLLSKSPLLSRIAAAIPEKWKQRVIYGLSTGTLDDAVARAIEPDVPSPTRRLETLRELQQAGFRTYAMLCPVLPQDPVAYAREAAERINFGACEHVWAEVLNRRGASMRNTAHALEQAGLSTWARQLQGVFGKRSTPAWEAYARGVFSALADVIPPGKLRFLQYVTHQTKEWWISQKDRGAVVLGRAAKVKPPAAEPAAVTPKPAPKATPALSPAKKAWQTMRSRYTPEQIRIRSQAAAKKAWETMRARSKARG